MSLIEKILASLGKHDSTSYDAGYTSIAEANPSARRISAEILCVPYVHSKEEFDERYFADFVKNEDENDESYQSRLSKLNENRFIPATEKTTGRKIILATDPTRPELDSHTHAEYGIISLDAYKEIVGITSDLTLSFDEDEVTPIFIRRLFRFAHDEKATDIDLTSMQATVSVKLKVSGEWTPPIGAFPITHKNFFMIALCSMASPSPVDYRSGRELKFRVNTNVDGIDLAYRISIIPTAFGENVAIRKLPGIGAFPSINDLGLSMEVRAYIASLVGQIDSPKKGGVVFITGETGSGKSTLLSAIEGEYLKKRKKVSTSEDPVEIRHPHPFLNQTEVGEDAGISHMDALAGFLRQNSDVIVIGECRKADELIAVINAGLSGHYAFTTMHTGSNEETLLRLEAMGVELNLLAGILRGMLSMTLVPKLCPSCKKDVGDGKFIRGDGCDTCGDRGILGVVPVGEFSRIGSSVKNMIGVKKPHEVMEAIRTSGDYISMQGEINKLKESGIIDAEMSDV